MKFKYYHDSLFPGKIRGFLLRTKKFKNHDKYIIKTVIKDLFPSEINDIRYSTEFLEIIPVATIKDC